MYAIDAFWSKIERNVSSVIFEGAYISVSGGKSKETTTNGATDMAYGEMNGHESRSIENV